MNDFTSKIYQEYRDANIGSIVAEEIIIEQVVLYAGDIHITPVTTEQAEDILKNISREVLDNARGIGIS